MKNSRLFLLAGLLAIYNMLIFYRILPSFLFADDFIQIYEQRFSTFGELIQRVWDSSMLLLFRPVHYIVLAGYYKLFYMNISLIYVIVFMAHLCASLCVFVFLSRIFNKTSSAVLGAVFFLTYMGIWEVVGWAAAIYYPLVIIFLLTAFVLYLDRHYVASSIFFVLAILTHESSILFVPLLMAYEITMKDKKIDTGLLKDKGFYLSVSIIFLIF